MSEKPHRGFPVEIPFIAHLGFELVRADADSGEIRFTPRPEHLNFFTVAHGGAQMTLLDVTMAMIASAGSADTGAVTIEMKASFLRPATGPLVCRGRLLHRTGSLAFVEAEIDNGEGQRCAHATGTFKIRSRRPTPD